MTAELLFRDDAYLKTATARVVVARVVELGAGFVELDRTIVDTRKGQTYDAVRPNSRRASPGRRSRICAVPAPADSLAIHAVVHHGWSGSNICIPSVCSSMLAW
jgi:hypothetical protein